MNIDLEVNPETVLIPKEFSSIGKAVADKYWSSEPEYQTFIEYAEENNYSSETEEEILGETPEEVAGAYMYVSGDSASEQDLEYESITGFESKLGRFEKM